MPVRGAAARALQNINISDSRSETITQSSNTQVGQSSNTSSNSSGGDIGGALVAVVLVCALLGAGAVLVWVVLRRKSQANSTTQVTPIEGEAVRSGADHGTKPQAQAFWVQPSQPPNAPDHRVTPTHPLRQAAGWVPPSQPPGAPNHQVTPTDPLRGAADHSVTPVRQPPDTAHQVARPVDPQRDAAVHDTADHGVDFWFVNANYLKYCVQGALPRHQEMRSMPGLLTCKTILPALCFKGFYRDIVAISHRWETKDHPDPKGTQLKEIVAFLLQRPEIEHVWVDWCSLPQGDRTPEEAQYFKRALKHVNILYLGLPVLIVQDMQYISRFWCLLEAWCAMQTPTPSGLQPAHGTARWRVTCRSIGAAAPRAAEHETTLISTWSQMGVQEAIALLDKDDVEVTNKSDKTVQMEKLRGLEQTVKQSFAQLAVYEMALSGSAE